MRFGSKRTENFPKRTEKLKSHEAQPSVISIFPCALENFPCALKAKSQITPLRRVMFAINTTTTSRRVCFNPKRTEKPCALGFSVRFGLSPPVMNMIPVSPENLTQHIGIHTCHPASWPNSSVTLLMSKAPLNREVKNGCF